MSPSEPLSHCLNESALRMRRPIRGATSGACLAVSALPAGCFAAAELPTWHACLAESVLPPPFSDACCRSAAFAGSALTEVDLHMVQDSSGSKYKSFPHALRPAQVATHCKQIPHMPSR